jgi:type I restriction enzyme S subunit
MISPDLFRKDVKHVMLGELVVFLDHIRKPITAKNRVSGKIPYYGANGVQGYVKDYLFNENLVLLAEDGGYFDDPDRGIAYKINGKTWVNNHAHVLRATPKIDVDYLFRVLQNLDLRGFVNGTTRAKLTKANAKRIPIPLPLLSEQRQITNKLNIADTILYLRKQTITKLDELAHSIFDDLFGDVENNDKNWPIKKLGELVKKLGSGATPRGGSNSYKSKGISLIRSLNVHDGVFKSKNLAFIDEVQAVKLSNVEVEKNDILLNITGASVGRVCIMLESILPARVNQHVMIIRPKSDLNPNFLERFLLNYKVKKKLLSISGFGATREAITKSTMENFNIIIPPIELQNEFQDKLNDIKSLKKKMLFDLNKKYELSHSLKNKLFC